MGVYRSVLPRRPESGWPAWDGRFECPPPCRVSAFSGVRPPWRSIAGAPPLQLSRRSCRWPTRTGLPPERPAPRRACGARRQTARRRQSAGVPPLRRRARRPGSDRRSRTGRTTPRRGRGSLQLIEAWHSPEELLAGEHGVHDDVHLLALDVADLEEDRGRFGPTTMMNPSPRSQMRTGLRYAWRMSVSSMSCVSADGAITGSSTQPS